MKAEKENSKHKKSNKSVKSHKKNSNEKWNNIANLILQNKDN